MSQSRLVVLLGLLVVVAGYAVYRYDLQPKREEVTALDARIAEAQASTTAAQAEVAEGREALARRPRDVARMTRAGRAVPDDLDQPSLVFQINAIAKRSGVDVLGVSLQAEGAPAPQAGATGAAASTPELPPGAVATAGGLAAQALQLEFRGTYGELTTFTRRLHALVRAGDGDLRVRGRLIDVSGMTLEPAESGFPRITSTLDVTTYLAPGGSALTASVDPAASSAGTATPTTATQETTP